MYGRFEGPREASLTAALSATKDSSCRDRAIGDIELRIPPARRLPDGAPAKLDEVEPVAIEGRAEFQREIVEQRSLMDGDDDLPLHLLRQCAQARRELSDVDLVNALDWVVNHDPRQLRLPREVHSVDEQNGSTAGRGRGYTSVWTTV